MHPLFYSLALFGVMEFFGDIWPGYIANPHCLPLMGCNLGFFGYEGLMHFISGLCVGLGILWAYGKGYVREAGAKAFLVWGAGIALVWELGEWSYDLLRVYGLGMDLMSPNRLAQPNGIDTIGDVVLALLGVALIYLWTRRRAPAALAAEA